MLLYMNVFSIGYVKHLCLLLCTANHPLPDEWWLGYVVVIVVLLHRSEACFSFYARSRTESVIHCAPMFVI